jgi:hypothetical protein
VTKKTLSQRLDDAKVVLDAVSGALNRSAGAVPAEIDAQFRGSIDARSDILHWKELIEARQVAWDVLDGLEKRVEADGYVPFAHTRARYTHARLLGVEAYLGLTWALADKISAMVGRLLCTPEGGSNLETPAQLVSHFVSAPVNDFETAFTKN